MPSSPRWRCRPDWREAEKFGVEAHRLRGRRSPTSPSPTMAVGDLLQPIPREVCDESSSKIMRIAPGRRHRVRRKPPSPILLYQASPNDPPELGTSSGSGLHGTSDMLACFFHNSSIVRIVSNQSSSGGSNTTQEPFWRWVLGRGRCAAPLTDIPIGFLALIKQTIVE